MISRKNPIIWNTNKVGGWENPFRMTDENKELEDAVDSATVDENHRQSNE